MEKTNIPLLTEKDATPELAEVLTLLAKGIVALNKRIDDIKETVDEILTRVSR